MVDTTDLKSVGLYARAGSSPAFRTIKAPISGLFTFLPEPLSAIARPFANNFDFLFFLFVKVILAAIATKAIVCIIF